MCVPIAATGYVRGLDARSLDWAGLAHRCVGHLRIAARSRLDGLDDARRQGDCLTPDQKVGGSSPSGRALIAVARQGLSLARGSSTF